MRFSDSSVFSGRTKSEAAAFYRHVLHELNAAGIRYLLGGTYGFRAYTGIARPTKDMDLFVCPEDVGSLLDHMGKAGFKTELTDPVWLGKVFQKRHFIDIIFRAGNGLAEVDEEWFQHSRPSRLFGIPVKLCPPEEFIWSKAFTMERDRFDGADILHMIHECATVLDWDRLLYRFGDHWRVLFSYLVLFGYVYPAEKSLIPRGVIDRLIRKLNAEPLHEEGEESVCRGPFLSRVQYRVDVEKWGYLDPRGFRRADENLEEMPEEHYREGESPDGVDSWEGTSPHPRKAGGNG